jgi:hypothetical protein
MYITEKDRFDVRYKASWDFQVDGKPNKLKIEK